MPFSTTGRINRAATSRFLLRTRVSRAWVATNGRVAEPLPTMPKEFIDSSIRDSLECDLNKVCPAFGNCTEYEERSSWGWKDETEAWCAVESCGADISRPSMKSSLSDKVEKKLRTGIFAQKRRISSAFLLKRIFFPSLLAISRRAGCPCRLAHDGLMQGCQPQILWPVF